MQYFDLMSEACHSVGVELTEDKYNKFMKYKELLQEWNEKVNLTAITDDEGIIKKHFIDSIKAYSLDEFKKAKNVIDVGTGAGFPGIPLAIIRDDLKVTLLDSLNKRVNFLDLVIAQLELKNIGTIHSRAEDAARKDDFREKYDIATSRAVANMSVLSELCLPYVKVGGNFIALKGPAVEEELSSAKNAISSLGGKLTEVKRIDIEDTELQHNLVVINKVKETSNIYPRKAGIISKNPIK